MLDYLREHGAIPARISPVPGSAAEELLERYRTFLIVERGLTAETALTYQRPVRRFLDELSEELGQVGPAEVSRFMTRHAQRRGQAYAERAATALRSFLGFALVEGLITAPLADTVPSAANWAGSSLPRGLAPGELAALLASCDRRRATGRRNYAILVVLGRLGLRAVEVANLRLEDIDWRAGEIVVQGKGSAERLPLPPDVGAAIASYVRRGRQHCADRAVFLRAIAPVRGLSPDGVGEMVRAASERAGLGSFGSHRLRHTAATEMLRAGASMSEVAQVLRHRRVLTTAIYAKVDHRSLVELARPWPEILR